MKQSKNCPFFQTALKTTSVLREYSYDFKPMFQTVHVSNYKAETEQKHFLGEVGASLLL